MAAAAAVVAVTSQMSVSSESNSRVLALLESDTPDIEVKPTAKRSIAIKKPAKGAGKPQPAATRPEATSIVSREEVLDDEETTGSHGVAETVSVPEATAERNITIPLAMYEKLVSKEKEYGLLQTRYGDLQKMYKELEEKKSVSGKSDNSPEDGKYCRWDVKGNRAVRARYVDNKKDIEVGAVLLGVRIDQKNNSKTYMKKADFRMVWVSKDIVKDTDTGVKYSHKWGIFQFIDEATDKAVSVKLMYDITPV